LLLAAPPVVEERDGQRTSGVAAGDRQLLLLFTLPLLELAGLWCPTGGERRPSLSLKAIAEDESAAGDDPD
jgi:hypothetical protein